MIELRWLQFEDSNFPKGINAFGIGKSTSVRLQYRTMTNLEEIGIQEAIWSEWMNIPTVKEEA